MSQFVSNNPTLIIQPGISYCIGEGGFGTQLTPIPVGYGTPGTATAPGQPNVGAPGSGPYTPPYAPFPPSSGPPPGPVFTNQGIITGGGSGSAPFIAVASDTLGNTLALDNSGEVWLSTNGGETWNSVYTGLPIFNTVAPGNLNYGNGTWVWADAGNPIQTSTDGGTSWNPIVTGIDPPGGGAPGSVAVYEAGSTNRWLLWSGESTDVSGDATNYATSLDAITWDVGSTYNNLGNAAGGALSVPIFDATAWRLPVVIEPIATPVVVIASSTDGGVGQDYSSSASTGDVPSNAYIFSLVKLGAQYIAAIPNNTYRANLSLTTLVTAANQAMPAGFNYFSALITIPGFAYAFDFGGNVCTWASGGGAWTAPGVTNLSDYAVAACYDTVHNAVIAVGSGGDVATFTP